MVKFKHCCNYSEDGLLLITRNSITNYKTIYHIKHNTYYIITSVIYYIIIYI